MTQTANIQETSTLHDTQVEAILRMAARESLRDFFAVVAAIESMPNAPLVDAIESKADRLRRNPVTLNAASKSLLLSFMTKWIKEKAPHCDAFNRATQNVAAGLDVNSQQLRDALEEAMPKLPNDDAGQVMAAALKTMCGPR